jgi:hypothetical protein
MVDADVAPFDPSERSESLLKGGGSSLVLRIARGESVQKGDPTHSSALLRACRKGPSGRRTAEQSDELPSPHRFGPQAEGHTLPHHRCRNAAFVHHSKIGRRWQRWVDTVEKGQNEHIEIFACAPVETGFS